MVKLFKGRFALDQEYADYYAELDKMLKGYEEVSIRKLSGLDSYEVQGSELMQDLQAMVPGLKITREKLTFKDFFRQYKKKNKPSSRK
jgi:hypothetical protein